MNLLVFGTLCGVIFAIITYIASNSIYSALIVALLTIVYFIYANMQIKKFSKKTKDFHNCYKFVNNFITSLSIKKSLIGAFDSCLESSDEEFQELASGILDLAVEDKLKYYKRIYSFHVYQLFLDLVDLWNEQGGDIIKMSHYLINQLREIEEYIIACERIHKAKTFEYIILWAISLTILVALKFALSDFYSYIVNLPIFQVSIILVFVFLLFSIQILINKIKKIEVNGWEEKLKDEEA